MYGVRRFVRMCDLFLRVYGVLEPSAICTLAQALLLAPTSSLALYHHSRYRAIVWQLSALSALICSEIEAAARHRRAVYYHFTTSGFRVFCGRY